MCRWGSWPPSSSEVIAYDSHVSGAKKCAQPFYARTYKNLSGEKILKIGPSEAEISLCVKSFKKGPAQDRVKPSLSIKKLHNIETYGNSGYGVLRLRTQNKIDLKVLMIEIQAIF